MNPFRIPTISVIERCEPRHIVIHTFPATAEGDAAAELLFRQIVREQDRAAEGESPLTETELDAWVAEGYTEDGGGWELYLIRSEVDDPAVVAASKLSPSAFKNAAREAKALGHVCDEDS